MKATIVMPDDAPKSKLAATRARGAEIVVHDRHTESREAIAQGIADATGATIVPPFDHPWIVAGAGTCVLELMEEVPGPGRGGDLPGRRRPVVRKRHCGQGVEPGHPRVRSGAGGGQRLLAVAAKGRAGADRIAADHRRRSAHDEAGGAEFSHHSGAGGICAVGERGRDQRDGEVRDVEAEGWWWSRAAVVGAAAVLHQKIPAGLGRVGVVLSGGNVDLEVLGSL